MNRAGGRPVLVSTDTAKLVDLAMAGRRATGGRFDPTLLAPLVDAGYDRSPAVATGRGGGFDPGGIGKGLAADVVVAELLGEGVAGACVNIGGDLRAEGSGPWTVDVADPFDGARPPLARLAFDAGGVATSSRLGRTWWRDGELRHHLIDPATGRPASTGVAAVTVLTGDAWRAEVLAKAALMAGLDEAFDVLAEGRATGLVVADDGTCHHAPGLDVFLA